MDIGLFQISTGKYFKEFFPCGVQAWFIYNKYPPPTNSMGGALELKFLTHYI